MTQDMTKGDLGRLLIRFSVPLVLSGVLQQLYAWADAFIVGHVLGENALAAIGATVSAYNLFIMVITGLTLGISVLSGRLFGQGEQERTADVLTTFSLVYGGVFLIVGVAGSLTAGRLLRAMHTDPLLLDMAEEYLRLVLLGVPFTAVYNVYAAVLRGLGESRAPFYGVLVASVVNVGLDLLLVAGSPMGVAGAAWATVVSQGMMALFLTVYTLKRRADLRPRRGVRWLDRELLRQGLTLGLPVAVQSSINSMGNMVLQNFMNSFSVQTVAAITTAYRVDTLLLLPILNLGSGISTVVAQNEGAGDTERVRKTLRTGCGIMAAVSLTLTAVIVLLGGYTIAMFGVTPETVEIGRAFFQRLGSFYLVFGLATACRGFLEGLGDVFYSSMSGIISLAVRIGLSYAWKDLFGNMVIAYAEGASWCLLLLLVWLRTRWKAKRLADGRS